MPINRDGKHWCDPASETPDENGEWVCPGCDTQWLFTQDDGFALWETPEGREIRLAADVERAAMEQEIQQDGDL